MSNVRKREWVYNGKAKSSWAVSYVDMDQKRCQKSFSTKKQADAFKLKVDTEIDIGSHSSIAYNMTLGVVVERYVRHCEDKCKASELTYGSLARINTESKRIPNWLKASKLSEIDTLMVQRAIDEKKKQYARSTMRGFSSFLGQVFAFSTKNKWIRLNPLAQVPLELPKVPQKRKRIPSKLEIEAILRGISERQHQFGREAYLMRVSIVTLALFGGLRRGEICGLKWEHVDFAGGVIRVRHSFSDFDGLKGPKTDAGIRDVPMAPQVRAILEYVRDTLPNSGEFVLKGPKGGPMPPKHITSHYWPAIMRLAGLLDPKGKPNFTFHALRHAAVSLLIEQGLLAIHIKELIGHNKVTTTLDTYGHLFPEDSRRREAMDKMAAAFNFDPPMAQSMALRTPGALTVDLGTARERMEIINP